MKTLALCFALLLAAPALAETWDDAMAIEHFIVAMRDEHGFEPAYLRGLFSELEPDPLVLKAIAPPSHPGQRSWARYRARFLTARRIRAGVAFWAAHAASLARAEKEFGVPTEVIVGIIGVETEYGRNTGGFSVLRALATLAFAYPPRAEYFRRELAQFLLLVRENGLDARGVKGSYAGAIGIPQFMPGSQRRFAVDFDDDAHIDLSASADDAIGSVASFLAQHGWVAGSAVARPAALSAPPEDTWLVAGIRPSLSTDELRLADATLAAAPAAKLALIDLVTPGAATEYWWGYENFYVITRYNRSSFYAMAVFQLAEAIASARRTGVLAAPPRAGSRAKRRRGG